MEGSRRISGLVVSLVVLQFALILLVPEDRIMRSSYAVLLALIVLCCGIACRQLIATVERNRPMWALLMLALMAKAAAFALLLVDSLFHPSGTLVTTVPTYLFCLSGLILVSACAYAPGNRSGRWNGVIDVALAVIMAVLFYVTLHSAIDERNPGKSVHFLLLLFDGLDLFVAIFVSIRLIAAQRWGVRRFFLAVTAFVWLDAIAAGTHNRMILASDSYLSEMLLCIPFAGLALILNSRRLGYIRRYRAPANWVLISNSLTPFVLSLGLCALTLISYSMQPLFSTIALALALTLYAIRTTATLSYHLTVEQELKTLRRRMQKAALIDELTRLPNRRSLQQALARHWTAAQRNGSALTLALIDVDSFKSFNDTYGHLAGDHCLKSVATLLASEATFHPPAVVGRFGGEEFLAVLANADLGEASRILNGMRAKIEALAIPNRESAWEVVTVSIGFVHLTDVADASIEASLEKADARLYEAKDAGRNRLAGSVELPVEA